ncbi:hypothetical protein A7Q09_05970 [Methylacidiphilum sp. Yel]|uniref:hypothetical protein n=1 Tax=Methylacidiphilum sp. Yel TaxID=1847730 RepID=UPI001069096B|nr:hypothetical protein [Methylacidiphilum sp. Yel]TFE69131.1 hypothetical protein A7Q09_05970 [Methylacidiphilum sp. Yel]
MKSFFIDSYSIEFICIGIVSCALLFLGCRWYLEHRLESFKKQIDFLNRTWTENLKSDSSQDEIQYLMKLVLERIDQLDQHLNERFDRIEQKLEQIDRKLSTIQLIQVEGEDDFFEENSNTTSEDFEKDTKKYRFRGEDGLFPFGLS